MKNTFLPLTAVVLFLLHAPAWADQPVPPPAPFPMERLEQARHALDAVRGDVAAVKGWLARGADPDVQGDLDAAYTIDSRDVPRVFEVLAGVSSPQWLDGTLFSPRRGALTVLRRGQTLQEILGALGVAKLFRASFSSREYALGTTMHVTDSALLTVQFASLVLTTPAGAFSFWTSPLPTQGEWVIDGSEPLSSWAVEGIDVRTMSSGGAHLSLLAVALPGEGDTVRLLLRGIPSFNPLSCAILYQRSDVIDALLQGGASPESRGPGGWTALHLAAAWGRTREAEALLRAGADIDSRTDTGATPLMTSLQGPPAKATVALRLEVTRDVQGSIVGVPDLEVPSRGSDSAMALFLLDRGADPSARSGDGETVLFPAARLGMLPLMARLLEKGSDINARDADGATALFAAARVDGTAALKFLVEAGIDIEARDANGETALFAAVRANHTQSLVFLVEHGASWNLRNAKWETPKWVAWKSGAPECVGILEYREPVHWSVVPAWNVSWAEVDGYDVATGFGAAVDVHVRLSRQFWLIAEAGYTSRGTLADTTDAWLPSPLGEPFYDYRHLDLACLVDFGLAQGNVIRVSALAGLGYEVQLGASLRTDSGLWEPVDLGGQLGSSGLCLVAGMGVSGFFWGGILVGVEFRYMQTLTGEWTSRGGALGSWVILARVGS